MPLFPKRLTGAGPSDPELDAAGVPETSPTWELELLISGAVLFALFQLPGLLDGFFARTEIHVTETMRPALFFVSLYTKAMVIALTAAFVTHLVSRAYWVGLVGLLSVFPDGVRWDEFKSGPIGRAVYQERLTSLPAIIARTDNFCSVLFSFGFLIVIFFAYTILLTGAFGAIAFGAAKLFLHGQHTRQVFFGCLAVMTVLPVATSLVDRRFGARMDAAGPGARVVRLVTHAMFYVSAIGITGPIFLTLVTNVGRRRMLAIFYFVLFGIILWVAADRLASSDRLSINSYDYIGSSDAYGVDFRYYESQRPVGELYPRVPSIQSDIIRDPYVKLFIPYSPMRHNDDVAARCPTLRPLQDRGIQMGSEPAAPDSAVVPVLRCLAEIHRVTLNGTLIPDPDFRFYEHPGTGIKGIITYLAADSLPRGRNVLVVQPAPVPAEPQRKLRPYVIPFWR
jgi:hypothetical protein